MAFHKTLLLALMCCVANTNLAAFISGTFRYAINGNGNKVCSIDQPSSVISMGQSGMITQCGTQCSISDCCYYYQFHSDTTNCDLYNYSPQNYTVVKNCIGLNTAKFCPPGWTGICSKCYKVSETNATWLSSMLNCSSAWPPFQPNLITINSAGKQSIVKQLLNSASSSCRSGGAWVGAQSTNATPNYATWVWASTPNNAPIGYTNWATSNPKTMSVQSCMRASGSSGTWTNVACNLTATCFACEM